ncbi:hypothetical protein CRYO30217_03434 [Parvicella tangerina]|uniref:DinB-like domain-containing protein n=2 Tax=Parvicella tangerina TaxID=2829795 RepID=A0A916JR41_9FLAO|nr:hypothetical protein CRYO30217_03434 [Parvicella tangerina]
MEESLQELVELTKRYHDYLITLDEDTVNESKEGKWSINEEIIHLVLSISPIIRALKMPKFQIRLLFGTASRPVYSFSEVEKIYREELGQGAVAPKYYEPKKNKFNTSKELYDKWLNKTLELEKLLNKWDQNDLDKVLLPHPSLGKLTISELVHFTLIHSKSHLLKVKNPETF